MLDSATSIESNNEIDLMKYVFCDNYSRGLLVLKGNFVNSTRLNVVIMVLLIVYGLLFLMQVYGSWKFYLKHFN